MATQTLPQVVPLPQHTEKITQTEIGLLLGLRARLLQFEEQVKASEESLKERLQAGAIVEPGAHLARLETHERRNVSWKTVVVRLANRLGLDGDAYCANVLEHTKPSQTVRLFLA